MKFDHIGITTTKKRPGEVYVEETKVWIVMSTDHGFPIEWLRYEPDSTVPEIIKETAHLGYEVDSLEEAGKNLKCILGPFQVDSKKVAFYELPDGGVVELMQIIE